MPREEFILSVRTAAGLVAPTVWADSQHLSPDRLTPQLQKAALWLTPKAVEGFDPRDFADLPAEMQAELRDAVERFRAVAATVPPNASATEGQFQEALAHLRRVVTTLSAAVRSEWAAAVD